MLNYLKIFALFIGFLSSNLYAEGFDKKQQVCQALESAVECYKTAVHDIEKPWSYGSDSSKCMFRLNKDLESCVDAKGVPRQYDMSSFFVSDCLNTHVDSHFCAIETLKKDMHFLACVQ